MFSFHSSSALNIQINARMEKWGGHRIQMETYIMTLNISFQQYK